MEHRNAQLPSQLSKVFAKAVAPFLEVHQGAAQQALGSNLCAAIALPSAAHVSNASTSSSSYVTAGGSKHAISERMEKYLVQCDKAISSGKREELPKELITKLDEQVRERQDKALAKSSIPRKRQMQHCLRQ